MQLNQELSIYKQFPLIHSVALWARQSVWSLKIKTMQQILEFHAWLP